MLLCWGLRKIVAVGALTLIDAHGRTHTITGSGGPSCTIRLHKRSLHRSLVTNPWLRVGEAYIDGTLTIEDGTLGDFLEILCLGAATAEKLPFYRLTRWLGYRTRWLQQNNPVGRAQINVAHHYDLTDSLYDLFLDADRQYSCAYFMTPGGYTPAMSETLAAVEHERLYVTDIEVLRLHYAMTLVHWHSRFQANRDKIAEIYDERFCRMWEFYLKAYEMAFRHWDQMVFQMQIARQQDAVPLVRDYITDWERANWDTDATGAKDAKDEGMAA